MKPRLIAISGKLKGASFNLENDAIVIGRDKSADLQLAEGSVAPL